MHQRPLEANRQHPGFLKVIVELNLPRVGLAQSVRKICPQALIVEPRYPQIEIEKHSQFEASKQFDAKEDFCRYYLERQGTTVPPSVLETFEQLYQEMSDASA